MLHDYIVKPSWDIPALEIIRDVQELLRDGEIKEDATGIIIADPRSFITEIRDPERTMHVRDDIVTSALSIVVNSMLVSQQLITVSSRRTHIFTEEWVRYDIDCIPKKDRELYTEIYQCALFHAKGREVVAWLSEYLRSGQYKMDMLSSLAMMIARTYEYNFSCAELHKIEETIRNCDNKLAACDASGRNTILSTALSMTLAVLKSTAAGSKCISASDMNCEVISDMTVSGLQTILKKVEEEGLAFYGAGALTSIVIMFIQPLSTGIVEMGKIQKL